MKSFSDPLEHLHRVLVVNCCLAPVCSTHNASLGCKPPTCCLHGHSLSCICEDKTLLFVSNQVSRFLLKKKNTLHIRWSRDCLTLWNPSSFINISPAAGGNSTTRSIVSSSEIFHSLFLWTQSEQPHLSLPRFAWTPLSYWCASISALFSIFDMKQLNVSLRFPCLIWSQAAVSANVCHTLMLTSKISFPVSWLQKAMIKKHFF